MATSSHYQPSKQLLRCRICEETLEEPRTLRCFHSFCRKCLEEYVKSQQEDAEKNHELQFNCPLCRVRFHVRKGQSVDQLPPNIFIGKLLKMFRREKKVGTCERCESSPTACKCVDCERYLCDDCLREHSKWPAHADHVVLTLEELASPEKQAKAKTAVILCNKIGHEFKPFELYCKTCQELACITCIVVDHSKAGHDYETASVAAKRQKEALKAKTEVLNAKSIESQSALEAIKYASQSLLANNKTAKEAILQQEKEILEEFTKKLKHTTAAMIVEVDKRHNEVNQTLVKQYDDTKAYEAEVSGLLEFAENVIEQGSNEETLLFGKDIEANADNIEKRKPNGMLPIHNGGLKYNSKTTKEVLEAVKLDDLGKIGMLKPFF